MLPRRPTERAEAARLQSTIWMTGLSGAGKSSLSRALAARLACRGIPCFVLDGDELRRGLNAGLGFTRDDRRENVRRAAEVALLMNDAGVFVFAALVSPYRADRAMAREIIGADRFAEVFVDAPLSVCERRDPKGLYRRARSGKLPRFTGVSDPWQPPALPDVRVPTGELDLEQCAEILWDALEGKGLVPRSWRGDHHFVPRRTRRISAQST